MKCWKDNHRRCHSEKRTATMRICYFPPSSHKRTKSISKGLTSRDIYSQNMSTVHLWIRLMGINNFIYKGRIWHTFQTNITGSRSLHDWGLYYLSGFFPLHQLLAVIDKLVQVNLRQWTPLLNDEVKNFRSSTRIRNWYEIYKNVDCNDIKIWIKIIINYWLRTARCN